MKHLAYAAWVLVLACLALVTAFSPGTAHTMALLVLAASAVAASAAAFVAVSRAQTRSGVRRGASVVAVLGAAGVLLALFLLAQPGAREGDIGGTGMFLLAVVAVLVAVPVALPARGRGGRS